MMLREQCRDQEELDLDDRQFTDITDVVKVILSESPTVRKLSLRHNNIRVLPESISELTNLHELDLRENWELNVDNVIKILKQMPNLQILHIECKCEEDEDKIAIALSQLWKLNDLQLDTYFQNSAKAASSLASENYSEILHRSNVSSSLCSSSSLLLMSNAEHSEPLEYHATDKYNSSSSNESSKSGKIDEKDHNAKNIKLSSIHNQTLEKDGNNINKEVALATQTTDINIDNNNNCEKRNVHKSKELCTERASCNAIEEVWDAAEMLELFQYVLSDKEKKEESVELWQSSLSREQPSTAAVEESENTENLLLERHKLNRLNTESKQLLSAIMPSSTNSITFQESYNNYVESISKYVKQQLSKEDTNIASLMHEILLAKNELLNKCYRQLVQQVELPNIYSNKLQDNAVNSNNLISCNETHSRLQMFINKVNVLVFEWNKLFDMYGVLWQKTNDDVERKLHLAKEDVTLAIQDINVLLNKMQSDNYHNNGLNFIVEDYEIVNEPCNTQLTPTQTISNNCVSSNVHNDTMQLKKNTNSANNTTKSSSNENAISNYRKDLVKKHNIESLNKEKTNTEPSNSKNLFTSSSSPPPSSPLPLCINPTNGNSDLEDNVCNVTNRQTQKCEAIENQSKHASDEMNVKTRTKYNKENKSVITHNSNDTYTNSDINNNKNRVSIVNCNHKVCTYRELINFITSLYMSKTKNEKTEESTACECNKVIETMEEHMYTYLSHKYGVKEIVVDWVMAIVEAIKKYAPEHVYVRTFGKVLRNEIDENFMYVLEQVSSTVEHLLDIIIEEEKKDSNYNKSKPEVAAPTAITADNNNNYDDDDNDYYNKGKQFSTKRKLEIRREEWEEIVDYMYDMQDAREINKILLKKASVCNYQATEAKATTTTTSNSSATTSLTIKESAVKFRQNQKELTHKLNNKENSETKMHWTNCETSHRTNEREGDKTNRGNINNIQHSRQSKLTLSCESLLEELMSFQLDKHEKFLFPYLQIFSRVDADHDGVVTRSEFLVIAKHMNKLLLLQRLCGAENVNETKVKDNYFLQNEEKLLSQSKTRVTFSEGVMLLESVLCDLYSVSKKST